MIERYFHDISMGTTGLAKGGAVTVAELSIAAGASAVARPARQESMPWASGTVDAGPGPNPTSIRSRRWSLTMGDRRAQHPRHQGGSEPRTWPGG